MKRIIEEQLTGVSVSGSPTPTTTGAFEVTNVKTNKKYHSKLFGDGYLDGDVEKLEKLVKALIADGAEAREGRPPIVARSSWCSVM